MVFVSEALEAGDDQGRGVWGGGGSVKCKVSERWKNRMTFDEMSNRDEGQINVCSQKKCHLNSPQCR